MRLLRKLSVLLPVLAGLLLSGIGGAFADTVSRGRVPVPIINEAIKGEQCVEPTDDMRRNHMEYILHQRDETVHRGIRTSRHSLKECIACHVSKDEQGRSIAINAEGQFCHSCHEYAAVNIDCFQCHATTPEGGEANLNTLAPPPAGLRETMAISDRFMSR